MFEYVLSIVATAVFAVTGVLAAAEREVDIFGVLVIGIVTAVGGGTIRDSILGVETFWIGDTTFLWVAAAASVATFVFVSGLRKSHRTLLYIDAFGVALFGVQGTHKALELGHGVAVAAITGVLTAIGGGVVRDLVSGRMTLLMRRELYATPILIGSVLCALLVRVMPDAELPELVGMVVIFGFRSAAIRWHLTMPDWAVLK